MISMGEGYCNFKLRAVLLMLVSAVAASLLAATPSWAALPDGRVDELVSTSGPVGEPYYPASPYLQLQTELLWSNHPFQASEDGEAVTYVGEPPSTGGTGEVGPDLGNQWLARRTAHGWETAGISPEAGDVAISNPLAPFEAFSPDLSTAILRGRQQGAPFTPEVPAGCHGLYARDTGNGELRALVTLREAPAGTTECGKPLFAGESDDASKVIFQSEAALTPIATEATTFPPTYELHGIESGEQYGDGCMFGCNLYEASAGHLLHVSVLPDGEAAPSATFGGHPGLREGADGHDNPRADDFSNAISSDGSRIFWTDTQEGSNFEHVFVLENETHPVQVSGSAAAEYWTATPDGRYAYYTEAGQLWQFDTATNTRTSITPEHAGVQGVIGSNQTGEDGGYLYFVADAALTPASSQKTCISLSNQSEDSTKQFNEGAITEEEEVAIQSRVGEEEAEEERGGVPRETGCNLYLKHDGRTTLIAVLSPRDNRFKGGGSQRETGDWQPNLGERTAEVTPDGRNLIFQSRYPLTGYHNFLGSNPIPEVFVYSAESARLSCASCNPAGAPPTVTEFEAIAGVPNLPVSLEDNTYMHRWISTDGNRAFFDSVQPLSPADQNSTQDVYEWEREGTTGCPSATSSYGGCIYLLSDATAESYSFLVDADATGDNVFFEHVGPLGSAIVPIARNELYDARVHGGFGASLPVCTGSGCQAIPPAAPSLEVPISATTAASGNYPPPVPVKPSITGPKPLTNAQKLARALKVCRRKHDKRKRTSCERQARRHYAAAHKAKHAASTKPRPKGRA
jgi:hypothetical protein